MRYRGSILGDLLKQIDRRQFAAIVDRYNGNAYDKSFDSWTHLVSLLCGQLGGAISLRELEATWNANAHHHYHLGVGQLRRSTLSDANRRRPPEIFADLFTTLTRQASRRVRSEGEKVVRLIDSTPILLKQVKWARWNGRIRGLKLHVLYGPKDDAAEQLSITSATTNDIAFGHEVPIERGSTYVFDRAYCHYDWWATIDRAGAHFVTRYRANCRLRRIERRPVADPVGDGFTVISDTYVDRASRSQPGLTFPLRLIRIRRENGTKLAILTNDTRRAAVEIGALYKARWQIELLFRWIKQHLNIRRFLGTSQNAVRLQILAAMIAFTLLRIVARLHRSAIPPIRFAQLVGACLFVRKPLLRVDKPPEITPPPRPRLDPNQLTFQYA
jgi:putative transposase